MTSSRSDEQGTFFGFSDDKKPKVTWWLCDECAAKGNWKYDFALAGTAHNVCEECGKPKYDIKRYRKNEV